MHILFGKKKSSKEPGKPNLKLSGNFEQELTELEAELNRQCTFPTVNRLISLYNQAISYYLSENNPKHILYQGRLQNLLYKSNVIDFLSKQPHSVSMTSPTITPLSSPKSEISTPRSTQSTISKSLSIPTIQSPLSPKSKPAQSDLIVERTCNKVLKDLKAEYFDLSKKIQENLKSQSESLNQRILNRKVSQTPRAGKSFVFDDGDYDLSGTYSKYRAFEDFEKELENILVNNIEQKMREKKKIEEKYFECFEEVANFKGDLKGRLIEELRNNMKMEINEALKELDRSREEKLESARSKLKEKV